MNKFVLFIDYCRSCFFRSIYIILLRVMQTLFIAILQIGCGLHAKNISES